MDSMTISIQDLGLFIIFCLIVAVAIFLIITLNNLNNIIKRANSMMDKNGENINKALTMLPETLKNVNDVAANVKENSEKVGNVIETVEGAVSETAAAVSDRTESILDFVKIANNVVKIILNMFSSSSTKE